jgi:hypothetical protein
MNWNNGNNSPSEFDIQYSNDGSIWITEDSYSNIPEWSLGEERTFNVT